MKTEIIYDTENRANLVISELNAMLIKATTGIDISYLDNGNIKYIGTYEGFIDALRHNKLFLIPIGFIHTDNEDIILSDGVIYSKIDSNDVFPLRNNEIMDIYFYDDGEMWKHEGDGGINQNEQAYIRIAPLSVFKSCIQYGFNSNKMKTLNIKTELEKVSEIIESIDEVINDRWNKDEHASEDFKQNQRISYALSRVIQAIELLNYEI